MFEKKLENLNVRHKINYGYNFVIKLMVVSGILSIIVLSLLFRDVRKNVGEAGGMLNSTTIVYGVGIVIIVAFVGLAIFFSKMLGAKIVQAIVEPLIAIEKVTEEIAAGNLHCEIDYHAKDKIGELAHNLRKSVSILASYVDDISNSMDEFSKGNFAVKPQVEWKGDFKGIRDSFIAFEESMSSTVKGIQQVADEVANGSEQVSESSMGLAQSSTEQAAVTEELTATITSISEQVAQNARNAEEISDKVKNLGGEIVIGNEKMQEMMTAMKEIKSGSEDIQKIIKVIDDIAFNTNILALNASVEASRAGEHGKGFVVVAEEVRNLAGRSAEASKQTADMIENSIQRVQKGSKLADDTRNALQIISELVERITVSGNIIAKTSDEQAASASQIDSALMQISQITQTNSATSEECAAASEELSAQTQTLNTQISKYKL